MADVKRVIIEKNGGPLRVNFKFKGLVGASYTFSLWEAKTNEIAKEASGNNLNDDDDSYDLPLPVAANEGRIIELDTLLKGLDEDGKYTVTAEVYQNDKLIGTEKDSGSIKSGEARQSFIYIRLVTVNES